ncbi:hypothetical protein [Methylobacterium nodulans]|uniref:Uncharacterized protein n=1 Tax=Methylobacterium nodulans (strain LMG 21967 / CNCM I-2342 / ORS 2060) TaxID=460265 RepID=B8IC50_METNO|nr:hypothetical protein [Methylobacterium nodulans]ACL61232.1 hypothetical protein Mnod_6454 [Methylobacterium nodulans ORS 2060]
MTGVTHQSPPTSTQGNDIITVQPIEKVSEARCLRPPIEQVRLGAVTASDALVAVHAAAMNPSDVKTALVLMPYAAFPA